MAKRSIYCREDIIVMDGYLFVLWTRSYEYYGENVYKIGKTKNVEERVQAFEVAYLNPVILKTISTRVKDVRLAEKLLFQKLADKRLHGNKNFFCAPMDYINEKINEVCDNDESQLPEVYASAEEWESHTTDVDPPEATYAEITKRFLTSKCERSS